MLQVAAEYCGGEVDEETKLNAGIGDMLLTGEVSHYSCYTTFGPQFSFPVDGSSSWGSMGPLQVRWPRTSSGRVDHAP